MPRALRSTKSPSEAPKSTRLSASLGFQHASLAPRALKGRAYESRACSIIGGWLLVFHLGTAAFGAAATKFFSELKLLRPFAWAVDYVFVVFISVGFLLVALMYASIYENQLFFYVGSAGVAVIFALATRIRLMTRSAISVGIAVFECVAAFVIAVSAVFVQGELVGRNLNIQNNPDLYDVFHGASISLEPHNYPHIHRHAALLLCAP